MNKTIKLDDVTYLRLEQLRQKRETYSDCVARLIAIQETAWKTADALNTALYPGDEEQHEKDS